MDPSLGFAQLLGIAQVNQKDKTTTDASKLLKTKFSGAKKEKREKGKLSANVQKFLQQKDAEERQKKIEQKLKRQNLNELRTDRAKNKIAKHLKVTKSANKAVLSDAIDKKNTSVTLGGRRQCDEDDYGYESKASQSFYEKLMTKYEADPDDPMAKFNKAKPKELKDMQGAKDRMKQALRKEEENPMIPGKRRRKRKDPGLVDDGFIDDRPNGSSKYSSTTSSYDKDKKEGSSKPSSSSSSSFDKRRKEEEARKKRLQNAKKAPPPVDFQSLLKMANQKKDIPVKLDKKAKLKDSEFGDRPMSKEEKAEYIRDNEARLRREGKLPVKEKTPPPKRIERIEKRQSLPEEKPRYEKPKPRPEPGPMFHAAVKKSMPPPEKRREDAEKSAYEREKRDMEMKMKELERRREDMEKKHKMAENNDRKRQEYERKIEEQKRRELKDKQDRRKMDTEKKELVDMQDKYKEMQRKMKEMEDRMRGSDRGGSSSSKGEKRDVNSVEARQFPGEKRRKEAKRKEDDGYKRRIESDSEDEYDSELEGFIDDTDDRVDISAEIRNIFGYDKRSYRDEDFDDRSMENNKFSSIMMEEARSARIGRMEDLEDMRREEEENKRKKVRR
eukprot:GFUD01021127.1.p1 GENE.GFUD01021127.1~~GFUD01021127.1.p1  ORF type:complete len:613 (+),score=242.70 GFUD01021127.1:176-2014(+)